MKLLPYLAPHKTNYQMIATRNIVFNFNATGFGVLEKYNDTKNYCFDDLGVEPTGSHYAKECNVMGEILLSRYDIYMQKTQPNNQQPITSNHSIIHLTTNLNAQELEKRYGSRIRSRLRAMFNLISFNENSVDKRR